MTANLGNLDRLIRAILGAILILLPLLNMPAIWSSAYLAIGSIAVGLVLLVTALVRFCPLYRILRLSTCTL
jgi:VIT1/CCC1 family predicted Fe2+/Mn2+ transporter